ncbi:X-ray repair cross complementing 3 (XRCC3) isoform 1 [Tripterygium wilfordii]|uniref:X-ray repair cross complementing 3 (XRCC3) isoform 1 n=1 Tax=Tripterygium wilfordii TaxID=458696 RepID=A0A7J7DSQ3_TRIWF|nr:DNA repair protein XRCC3 homolog [Tripterygium wilfordii]KAF5749422.1 X-ray repair cross complementing 3 (XRCC3) isoform 1 [Tripterygium wilfordii]
MAITPENLLNGPLSTQKCTLGCPILDRSLGGGVPCNSITEIVAESGSGKTQLCLQIALHFQLPVSHGGLAASSLYLHTEFPFPFRRLHQLSHSFCSLYNRLYNGVNYNPCDHLYVHSIHTADQLLDIMSKIESFLVNRNTQLPVKLIVIDSIAALFRSEFDNTPRELKRRSALFFKISGKLKALAKRFSLAVVVTNQVVDFMGPSEGINGVRVGNLGALYSSGRRVCAALGLAWANCVNSRLFLSREEEIVREDDALVDCSDGHNLCRRTTRFLHVIFAPHLPDTSCEFEITRDGVFGVERR